MEDNMLLGIRWYNRWSQVVGIGTSSRLVVCSGQECSTKYPPILVSFLLRHTCFLLSDFLFQTFNGFSRPMERRVKSVTCSKLFSNAISAFVALSSTNLAWVLAWATLSFDNCARESMRKISSRALFSWAHSASKSWAKFLFSCSRDSVWMLAAACCRRLFNSNSKFLTFDWLPALTSWPSCSRSRISLTPARSYNEDKHSSMRELWDKCLHFYIWTRSRAYLSHSLGDVVRQSGPT